MDGGGAGEGSEATEPRPCPFRFGERGAGAPVVPPVAAATTGKARPWAAHSLVRGRRGREPPRLSRTTRTRAPGAWREGCRRLLRLRRPTVERSWVRPDRPGRRQSYWEGKSGKASG